jgi:hypothetical protein
MQGIGRIFEAYRDGVLEDDDEVAVIHGPAETGFLPLSDAMVNIRATLAKAVAHRLVSPNCGHTLEACAKSLFFHRRDWPLVLDVGRERGASPSEIEALQAWLPHGRVDQKRDDALAMLAAMRESAEQPSRQEASFSFEWTHFFDEMIDREWAKLPSVAASASQDAILDELRLQGIEAYRAVKARALVRLGGEARSARAGYAHEPDGLRAELGRVRAERGLFTRRELDAWMARNDLDEDSLETLLRGSFEARAEMAAEGPAVDQAMLDELRLCGSYEVLAARARAKSAALADGRRGQDLSPSAAAALAKRLTFLEGQAGGCPGDDVEATVRALGFRDLDHLDKVLREEQYYLGAGK